MNPNTEKVNHPDHYAGNIECIDAIEAAVGTEGLMAFCRANAIKYLWRAGKKDDTVADLKKAVWYINKLISLYETSHSDN